MSERSSKSAKITKGDTPASNPSPPSASVFKFAGKSASYVEKMTPDSVKMATSGLPDNLPEPVMGRGPEIRGVLSSVIKHAQDGRNPFVSIFPYECVSPGIEGNWSQPKDGSHEIVNMEGKIGAKGSNWRNREATRIDLPLRTDMVMSIPSHSIPSTGLEPGTGIVLCGMDGTMLTDGNDVSTYMNARYIRRDENYTLDKLFGKCVTNPMDLEVMTDSGISVATCGAPIAENVSSEFSDNDKMQLGCMSEPSFVQGMLGPSGANRDYFSSQMEIVTVLNGKTTNAVVQNFKISRRVFQQCFDITSSELVQSLGPQILSNSRYVIAGTMKSYKKWDDDSGCGSIVLWTERIISSLRDVVITCGVPVSGIFARENYQKYAEAPGMTLDRDVILLNECMYPSNVSKVFKLSGYEFYAITNINIEDELTLAKTSKPTGHYDTVLKKLQKANTVYAIYAVKTK